MSGKKYNSHFIYSRLVLSPFTVRKMDANSVHIQNQHRIITCVLPECLKLPSNSDTSAPLPQEPLMLGEDQCRVELSATKALKPGESEGCE